MNTHELNDLVDRQHERIGELETELDALAAKVIEKCEQLKYRDSAQRRYNLALGDIQAYVETLTPATSFGRLKAQWQAEALEYVEKGSVDMFDAESVRAFLRNKAKKLRRQTEGGPDDTPQEPG